MWMETGKNQKGPKAGKKGFMEQPLLWIVERTFAWLRRYRRLSKDYESLTETSEAMKQTFRNGRPLNHLSFR